MMDLLPESVKSTYILKPSDIFYLTAFEYAKNVSRETFLKEDF